MAEITNTGINLPPPTLQFLTTEQQIEALQVANPNIPKDEIVAFVKFQDEFMQLDSSKLNLDTVPANDPQLYEPGNALGTGNEVARTARENPWLGANTYATFFMIFLTLQAELSKIKVAEGMATAKITLASLEMAKDLAQLVKEIKMQEAAMHTVSAVANGIGAVVNIGTAIVGFKKAGPNESFNQGVGYGGQGIGQLVTMGEKIGDAVIAGRQAELEFTKTIVENCLRVMQDRGISTHTEAQRTADEMISQILQKLDKIIDEAFRGHGFSRN